MPLLRQDANSPWSCRTRASCLQEESESTQAHIREEKVRCMRKVLPRCWSEGAHGDAAPLDFASATARKKPSSRAALRREMAARAEASRVKSHERSTSPKTSGERAEYAAGRHRKHSHHPHATSPPKAAPKPTGPRDSSERARSHKQPHKQSNKPTVDRTSDSATKRAWAEMQQKMSKAATK